MGKESELFDKVYSELHSLRYSNKDLFQTYHDLVCAIKDSCYLKVDHSSQEGPVLEVKLVTPWIGEKTVADELAQLCRESPRLLAKYMPLIHSLMEKKG